MSYLLLIQSEIINVKLIIKLRGSDLDEKKNILSQCKFSIPANSFYCFSDKDMAEHLANLEFELNNLLSSVNIGEAYER